jgi:hypothetical protein
MQCDISLRHSLDCMTIRKVSNLQVDQTLVIQSIFRTKLRPCPADVDKVIPLKRPPQPTWQDWVCQYFKCSCRCRTMQINGYHYWRHRRPRSTGQPEDTAKTELCRNSGHDRQSDRNIGPAGGYGLTPSNRTMKREGKHN